MRRRTKRVLYPVRIHRQRWWWDMHQWTQGECDMLLVSENGDEILVAQVKRWHRQIVHRPRLFAETPFKVWRDGYSTYPPMEVYENLHGTPVRKEDI